MAALSPAGVAEEAGWLWQERLPWPVTTLAVSSQGIVLFGSDRGSVLRAVEARRGTLRWQRDLRAAPWSPPALQGSTAYLVPYGRRLLALGVGNGELAWSRGPRFPEAKGPLAGAPDFPDLNRAPPAAGEGRLAVLSLHGRLVLLDPQGRELGRVRLSSRERFWARPVMARRALLAASLEGRLWRVPLEQPGAAASVALVAPGPRWPGRFEVRADLAASRDRLYLGTVDGTVFCFSLEDPLGKPLWVRPPAEGRSYQVSDAGQVLGGPVPDGAGRVYVSLRHRVLCLDDASGELIWAAAFPEGVQSPPALAEGHLVVAAGRRLHRLQGEDGSPLGSFPLPGEPTAGPVVWGRVVVLGFSDGTCRGFTLDLRPASVRRARSGAAGTLRGASGRRWRHTGHAGDSTVPRRP